jgi:ABC-type transport system involved in multi-copper enzyme maturation permease subunit
MTVLRPVSIVASYTLKELLKSKVLVSAVVMSFGIALLAWLASEFTFGVPARVALDVGLAALSVSGYGIAIFMGATLISREIESRTIYMVISRPISREAFLIGKMIGLTLFLAINLAVLAVAAIGVAWVLGLPPSWLVLCVFLASLLECVILMLVVVLLSLGSNTPLTVIFSVILLLAGHAIGETRNSLYVQLRPALAKVLDFFHYIFPGFYKFNLKDLVIYQLAPPAGWLSSMFSYGLCYATFLAVLICLAIRKKDFN